MNQQTNEEHPLASLYRYYRDRMDRISKNRSKIERIEKENRGLQKNLETARDNIKKYFEIHTDESVYYHCKQAFGDIDKRYYSIQSILGQKNK